MKVSELIELLEEQDPDAADRDEVGDGDDDVVAVWSVKAALEAAYRAGLAAAKEER